MNRKKFFSALGIGIVGYLVSKSIPGIPFVDKIVKSKNSKVSVKINPDAVRREKNK